MTTGITPNLIGSSGYVQRASAELPIATASQTNGCMADCPVIPADPSATRPAAMLAVSNILTTYAEASAEQRASGLDWYPAARRQCFALARRHHLTLRQVAGIVAALSPQTRWEQNLQLAETFISTGKRQHTSTQDAKARAILAGGRPLSVLRGPKERAFYRCIVGPTQSTSVCIDRHACDVATGAWTAIGPRGRKATDAERTRVLGRKGGYEAIERAYIDAAAQLAIHAPALQAITWIVQRDRS